MLALQHRRREGTHRERRAGVPRRSAPQLGRVVGYDYTLEAVPL